MYQDEAALRRRLEMVTEAVNWLDGVAEESVNRVVREDPLNGAVDAASLEENFADETLRSFLRRAKQNSLAFEK